jgi:hypothetical protein
MFSTVGHIEQSAIVNSAAGAVFSKITRPSGNQASGETGPQDLDDRVVAFWNAFERPIAKPSGVPMSSASP